MIVRMSDKLANVLVGEPQEESPIVDESRVGVWDGEKLVYLPAPSSDGVSHLIPLVPQWLKDIVLDGTTMIVPPEDFAELDYEVQEHFEIIKY